MARRWERWSERWRPVLTVVGVTAVGLAAEWQSVGFGGQVWIPDLLTGVGLAVAGAVIRTVDQRSRVGDLVALAGFAWFVPNFAALPIPLLAWLAAQLTFAHRAVLVHAIVAFPRGRIGRPLERIAMGLAYGSTLLSILWTQEGWTIAWAVAVLLTFIVLVRFRDGPARDAGVRVIPTMALLSLVIAGAAAMLLIFGDAPPPTAIVHAYETGIVAVGFVLAYNMYDYRAHLRRVTDAVVELTIGPAGYVRELLADALRDPSVEVAFAIGRAGTTRWVDELGRPIEPLRATGSRAVVPILVDGRAVAQLGCESALLDQPGVLPSIEAATRLAASNVQLRANLRAEAASLQASTLRLLSAADDQRIQLVDQLDGGAGVSLAELRVSIERLGVGLDPVIEVAYERSRGRLAALEGDLRSLAAGLGPLGLHTDGLAVALSKLASDANVAIRVEIEARDLPDRLATAVYFICAEAIANALKHAFASAIIVSVREAQGGLRVEISDDGRGGANPDHGSGLRGLGDRASALGGSFSLESPVDGGTHITADLPIR